MKRMFVLFIMSLIMINMTSCGNEEKAVNIFSDRHSPILYKGDIYFYSEDETFSLGSQSLDEIDFNNVSYIPIVGNILEEAEDKKLHYDSTSSEKEILVTVEDSFMGNYIKSGRIENEERLDKILSCYNDFIIEKQEIGMIDGVKSLIVPELYLPKSLSEEIVAELKTLFGEVEYDLDELKGLEEVYFIKAGCEEYDEFLSIYCDGEAFEVGEFYDTEMPEIYVGMIIKKSGKYYYGSLDNEIPDYIISELGI